jgi:signal transduction histidine kinase
VFTLLVLLGLATFLLMMVLARRLQVRLFFPSTLAFPSTIKDLSDQLASLRDMVAIQSAVEKGVEKAIPTFSAQVLSPDAVAELSYLPEDSGDQLGRGENVWADQSHGCRHLLIPMRSLGELRAVLLVAPKREAAIYTQEDLHLLETIASLGALALHNAEFVQEIESIRRLEVGAAQKEKRLALGALGTEICHEMVYPLNFLRDLLRRHSSGQPLDGEGLAFARAEIDRMTRLIHSLRQLEIPAPRVGSIPLAGHAERALLLLRELIQDKRLSISVEIPPEVTVTAESDSLVQLLSNLLRNAAQATPLGGAIGIRSHLLSGGQLIEIWDTGPGIPAHVAEVLFTRRITTKEEGYGIGLSIVQRIARSFQWVISFRRESNCTIFSLTLT